MGRCAHPYTQMHARAHYTCTRTTAGAMINLGEINYHCCHLPRGTCTIRACSGGSSSVAAHSSPLPCLPAGAKLSTTSSARRGEPGQRVVAITVNSLSLPSVRCERAFHPHYPLRCRDTPAFGALHHAKTCLLPLCGSAELAHHEASSCCQRVARAARHKPVAPCQPARSEQMKYSRASRVRGKGANLLSLSLCGIRFLQQPSSSSSSANHPPLKGTGFLSRPGTSAARRPRRSKPRRREAGASTLGRLLLRGW